MVLAEASDRGIQGFNNWAGGGDFAFDEGGWADTQHVEQEETKNPKEKWG
jgi:hypothetical protein